MANKFFGVKTPLLLENQYKKRLLKFRKDIYKVFYDTINLKAFSDDLSQDNQIDLFTNNSEILINHTSKVMPAIMNRQLYLYFNKQFIKNIKGSFELDLNILYNQERELIDQLVKKSGTYIKKYGDDMASWLSANVRDNWIMGGSQTNLEKGIAERFQVDKRRAKLIARNETSSFIGAVELERARNLGIEEAIWRTSLDERVRKAHRELNGVKFRLDKGAYSKLEDRYLFPKVSDIQCRCTAFYLIN